MGELYNEEFKKKYLEEEKSRNVALSMYMQHRFRQSASYEESLGKDIYDFTIREITDYYKMLCSTSLETLMVLNSQFSIYTRYAISNNITATKENHFDEIDNEILNTCINKNLLKARIYTRDQLYDLTKNMPNPSEKYIVYALFEGITGKKLLSDLVNLTRENFKGNKVYLPSGKVLSVSNELISLMNESVDEYTYYGYTQDGGYREFKFKEGDDKVIKEMYNAVKSSPTTDYRRVQNRLVVVSKANGLPNLTARTLLVSGEIDMIKHYMKNEHLTAEQAIRKYKTEIEYRYGAISAVKRFVLKYEDFLKDE